MSERDEADRAGGAGPDPDAGRADEPGPALPRRVGMLATVALTVIALDLVTKIVMVATLADGERIQLVDGLVSLVLVRNPGAAFSLATGMTWVLTLVALLVVAGIVRYARRLRSPGWAFALGLVLGGAVGNLVDRFFRGPGPLEGHVVDFVSVGWWPVFNVADSSICVGGAVLVVLALRGIDIDGSRPDRPEPHRPGTPRGGGPPPARPVHPATRWEDRTPAPAPGEREGS